jgi:MFS family permease
MLATLPSTVAKGDLLSANSFLTVVDTVTEVVGPVLAGTLVQTVGYSAAMYVDAASYLTSGVIVSLLSTPPNLGRNTGARASQVFSDIGAGFRYVRRDRIQLGLFILIFLGWWVSGLNSLQTPLAKGVFGLSDTQFGWFNGVWGGGFVLASLLLGWYGGHFPKGQLIAAGFLGWVVATGVTGTSANAGMLYASIFWVGIANIVLYITLAATIMEVTPADILGRVLTLRQVALASVRVLAMLIFGKVADFAGVRTAVLCMSGVSLLGVAVGFIAFPEILRIGQSHRPAIPALPPTGQRRQPWGRLVGALIDSSDPTYRVEAQRVLNMSVLLIVGAAWVAIALRHPSLALFVSLAIGMAPVVRLIHRRWRDFVGSKDVRHRTLAVGSRELGQGGRKHTVTGPTTRY